MPTLFAGVSRRRRILPAAITLLVAFNPVIAFQYKVGDLDSWGIPPPSLPNLYAHWVLNHHFHMGDSLLFLYPPSQDNVVQVTERAFNACNVTDPILKMEDGNSIFNLSTPGTFYFTSGVSGHCDKRQKLQIAVPDANGTYFQPTNGPAAEAEGPAAFPLVFGPTPGGSSAAPERLSVSLAGRFAVAIATFCCLFRMV
ncbi:early nodulin-like protein 1 [Phalaenopsis equestris]|uniref:early nodulin-like protein 1 n=1 Tax=Phalaenopsis equestris TaxID=78828 RepID=UPI0009E6565E|nr:early nodulin-like protein 1 [Phalaenopsis equestris]